MKPGMDRALSTLQSLLDADDITSELYVRAHGDHLILACEVDEMDSGEPVLEDRIRLTRLSNTRWGLSVRRHTQRWEQTPFTGSMEEMVDTICSFMQHLVVPY